MLTNIDFSVSGAKKSQIALANEEFFDDGVIVQGYRIYDDLDGKGRSANKFFTRAPVPLR